MSHTIAPSSAPARSFLALFFVLTLVLGVLAPAARVEASDAGRPTQESDVSARVTGDVVNLRGGPGTGYAVVGRPERARHSP